MDKFRPLFGAAILTLASMPVNAGLIRFYEYSDWAAAISGDIILESFDSPSTPDINSVTITFDGGIRSTANPNPGQRTLLNQVNVPESRYEGRVGLGSLYSHTITWTLPGAPSGTLGFFADFLGVDSLDVAVGGYTERVVPSSTGGFGIVIDMLDSGDTPFSAVSWGFSGTSPDGANDMFAINAFSYVAPVSAVPVPPALWLFGTGLLGLIGFGRRSKAA